jgi:hypothetical protein
MDDKEILLEEWKDIRETLRYFGNKRFAQLTVFLVAEGAAISAFLKPTTTSHHHVFQIAGLILAVLFYMMERSFVRYWKKFAERGEAIESQLPQLELMTKYRPKEGSFGATSATYTVYFLVAVFWLFSFGCWGRAPAHTGTIRIVVAGDGRAEYPSAPKDKKRYEDDEGINKKINTEIAQAVLSENAQMMLWTGDLVNVNDRDSGTFKKELLAWRNIMQPLYDRGVVVLPVRGNHEVIRYVENGPPEGEPITEATKIWNEVFSGQYALPGNGPEKQKNLSFYCVRDSVLAVGLDQYEIGSKDTDNRIDQAWFDQVLKDRKKPFIFVYGHEPAFMAGNHTDTLGSGTRNAMWESLIQAGARVYFCGHDHFYDHMGIVRETGDPGPAMHQLTAGTAGAPFYKTNGYIKNPGWKLTSIKHIENTYGYILITIDGNKATVTFKGRISPGQYQAKDSFSYTASAP